MCYAASTTDWPHLVASSTYNDAMEGGQSVVEAAFLLFTPTSHLPQVTLLFEFRRQKKEKNNCYGL